VTTSLLTQHCKIRYVDEPYLMNPIAVSTTMCTHKQQPVKNMQEKTGDNMQDKATDLPEVKHHFPTHAEMESALKRRVDEDLREAFMQEFLRQLDERVNMHDEAVELPEADHNFSMFVRQLQAERLTREALRELGEMPEGALGHFPTIADWEVEMNRTLKDKTFERRVETRTEGVFIVYEVYNKEGEIVTESTVFCGTTNKPKSDDTTFPTIGHWEVHMNRILKDKSFVRRLETRTEGVFIVYEVYNKEGDVVTEYSMFWIP
jgi:hypothetical protein